MSSPMDPDLLDEIHALHTSIRASKPGPSSQDERRVADTMQQLQSLVTTLIASGVPPPMVEMAMFYHWLRLSLLSLGDDGRVFDRLAEDLHGVTGQVVACVKKVVAEVRDDGPSTNMRRLGNLLEKARARLNMADLPPLSQDQVEQRANQTNVEIMGFVHSKLVQGFPPGRLIPLLLYHWLRLSTFREQVDEGFFQKAERNWPVVAERVFDLIRQIACL